MAEPKLPFANDGSFLELFAKMQEQQKAAGGEAAVPPLPPAPESEAAAASAGSTGGDGSADADAQQAGDSAAAGNNGEGTAAPGGESAADAAAGPAAANAADPPPPPPPRTASEPAPAAARPSISGRPASAPAMLLKAKKSIVQVRTRTGEALQPGGSKRAKKEEDKAASGDPKSFYLQELERYRQVACEGSAGSDRPLVK